MYIYTVCIYTYNICNIPAFLFYSDKQSLHQSQTLAIIQHQMTHTNILFMVVMGQLYLLLHLTA